MNTSRFISWHIVSLSLGCIGLSAAWAEEMEVATLNPNVFLSCQAESFSIALEVHNVRRNEGLITVDLHDNNPEGFLKKAGLIERIRAAAESGVTRFCIPVDQAGTYAIAPYHDRNADFVFDKNWIGLPAEPYGVSNEPPIRLGPLSHSAAAFEVSGPATPVTVTLRGK